MSIRTIKQGFLRTLGNLFLGRVIDLWCKTLKINYLGWEGIEECLKSDTNMILAFWHGTMIAPWFVFRDKKFMGLTSLSKDGDILARILTRWGYNVNRGSSSRGGNVALGIMVDFVKYEGSVLVTPDGPRGPERKFKPGAVISAQRSGKPLLLVGVGFEKKWHLKSWDKFEIPKPFSRVNVSSSLPINVSVTATRDEISDLIINCETKLSELQKQAESF